MGISNPNVATRCVWITAHGTILFMAATKSPATKKALTTLGALTALGAAGLAYALAEARSYRLRTVAAPVLPDGADPITVLHLTDLHLTPRQQAKSEWIKRLAVLEPDFVVGTGDFMAHPDAVRTIIESLGPLLDRPGAFVFGSNDYYAPKFGNPLTYLSGPSRYERGEPDLPWEDLAAALSAGGWVDLSNRRDSVTIGDLSIDLRGVDDPHIQRDNYDLVAGPFDAKADLHVGVAHAPYLRVLDAMSQDNADLILAGHTHGGQVCIPGYGALVTNCDLDTQRVKGLHMYGDSWMHVSAGLGTNPMTPVRFACPPEATLLTLTSR